MFTLGQVPFAASSDWNTPITEGSTYTPLAWPTPTGYNYSVAWDSYSPAVYVASPTDPLVQVYHPATWGYPAGYVYVHMPAAANGAAGTDGELLAIDDDIVYNFWQFERTSLTTATAVSFGQENVVTGDGWGSKSPFLGAGITAVGASQLGGLLVKAETDTGVINHALQLTVEFNLAKSGFTGDAIAGDGSSSTGIVQEGDHLAIPLGTPMPSGLSPLAQEVFIALQNYGAYVVDVSGGTTTLRAQANAYDDATMTALWHDMSKITPLLGEVSESTAPAFSAATASITVYTAEYGVAPGATELDNLIQFTMMQYAYAKQVGYIDPSAYAYEALGVALAPTATLFQNTYGLTNPTYPNTAAGDAQYVMDAYTSVFGHSPTSAQAQVFINELNLLENLYTASGAFGTPANINLLARGATYGNMLGIQAEHNDVPIIGISASPHDTLGG